MGRIGDEDVFARDEISTLGGDRRRHHRHAAHHARSDLALQTGAISQRRDLEADFAEKGFKVQELFGGIAEWKNNNFPIEKTA